MVDRDRPKINPLPPANTLSCGYKPVRPDKSISLRLPPIPPHAHLLVGLVVVIIIFTIAFFLPANSQDQAKETHMPNRKTVRIALAIDEQGNYSGYGQSIQGDNISDDEIMANNVRDLEDGGGHARGSNLATYWLEAEVPIPEPARLSVPTIQPVTKMSTCTCNRAPNDLSGSYRGGTVFCDECGGIVAVTENTLNDQVQEAAAAFAQETGKAVLTAQQKPRTEYCSCGSVHRNANYVQDGLSGYERCGDCGLEIKGTRLPK